MGHAEMQGLWPQYFRRSHLWKTRIRRVSLTCMGSGPNGVNEDIVEEVDLKREDIEGVKDETRLALLPLPSPVRTTRR